MNKLENTLKLAKASLVAVDAEINERIQGVTGVGTLRQLEHIRSSCSEMIAQIDTGNIRGTDFGIARMIVDSWPLSSSLGELLIKTEKAYNAISVGAPPLFGKKNE